MPNNYSQVHLQLVFAVKYREAVIHKSWKENLHKFITRNIESNKHKLLQINSMPDHVHILIGMRPHQSISNLVQDIKVESSKWIKEQKFCLFPFSWQEGYGVFSYSKSHVDAVIRYIQNQEIHQYLHDWFLRNRKTGGWSNFLPTISPTGQEYKRKFIFIDIN